MEARFIYLDSYRASNEFRYLSLREHIYYGPGWIHINKGSLQDLNMDMM